MKLKNTAPKFMLKPVCAMLGMLLAAPTVWAANYPNVPLALTGGQSSVKTNVLLFIDTSGSMRNPISPNSSEIRQVGARKAAKQVIADNPNLRFGLATFNDNQTSAHPYPYIYGANIRIPIDEVADKDGLATVHKNNLDRAIDNLVFSGGTPTTSAYYELTRYFRGMSGAYPDEGGSNRAIAYTSPIEYRCQKNAIVFISDGQPQTSPWNRTGDLERTYSATYDASDNQRYKFYPPKTPYYPLGEAYEEQGPFGHSSTRLPLADSLSDQEPYNGSTVYTCTVNNTCTMYNELGLSHFARIAHTQDMMQGGVDKEGQSFDDPKFAKQTIETYTIGFGENIPMLSHAATEGGGAYFTATSAAQLQEALKNIFQSIPSLGEADFSAVAPTTSGTDNQITSAQTVSLNTTNWSSQLRFYRVGENNQIDSNSYTQATYAPANSVAVISTDNGAQTLANSNTALNNSTFALDNAATTQWQKLVQWLTRREADANTGYRVRTPDEDRYLGDVLGSSLTALGLAQKSGYTYGASNQEFLAVGANDGMAHIYRKTGAADDAYTDVFQYIPGLARNQEGKTINERLKLTAAADYGAANPNTHQNLVNGPISWHETFATDNRSRVFLTGTLGEGGRAAYALNIAGVDASGNGVGLDGGNWASNVPLWDTSSASIGAAKTGVDGIIGHTFGLPFNGRIALGGSKAAKEGQYRSSFGLRYATVLGSGFDPAANADGTYPAPSVFVLDSLAVDAGADGNGRFLNPAVSGAQGALLRQISVAGLAGNIDTASPKGLTSPTGLDIDGDGLWDVAYAGDQNGNVYRFDFRAEQSKWNAEIIFRGNAAQPITAQPNVYRSPSSGRVTVLFGTGSELYSSDLSDTGLQRFYGIQDPLTDEADIGGDLATSQPQYPITPDSSALLQQTYQQSSSGAGGERMLSNQQAFNFNTYKGWYMDLTNNGVQEGERVVTMPEVGGTKRRGGSVLFTTRIFKPGEGNGKTSCTAPSATSTSGFLMTVNAETGGRAPGLRFLQDNQDMIGVYYGGSLSSPKLAGNNTYDQTVFGGSRSGRAFRLNSNPEIPSGCTNDTIQVGVGSSQDGAALRAMYCPSDLSVRRISWREIF